MITVDPSTAGAQLPVIPDFEDFCREVSPKLIGALTVQCGDREVAKELAQEALARTWQRWDDVAAMKSPTGWTFRVAFNLANSHHRREQRARRWMRGLKDRHREDNQPWVCAEDRLVVRQALDQLTPRQRAAVTFRYFLRFSSSETAEVMGCSSGTVRSLCSQAIASLRGDLGDELMDIEREVADAEPS